MKFDFDDETIRSMGEFLRRARESQELTLEEVAKGTRINQRFLEALEEDHEEELPDLSYRDLFIKSYAEFLGFDAEEVLLRLPERKPKTKKQKAAAEKATAKQQQQQQPAQPLKPIKPPSWGRYVIYALLVVVVIGAIWVFSGGKLVSDEEPAAKIVPPETSTTVAATHQPVTQDSLFLLLVGQERCWLDVRVDGDSVYTRFIGKQDTVRFAIADSVVFKMGKANAIQGWLNGLPLQLAEPDDSATAQFQLDKLNYPRYVDSSRLVE